MEQQFSLLDRRLTEEASALPSLLSRDLLAGFKAFEWQAAAAARPVSLFRGDK